MDIKKITKQIKESEKKKAKHLSHCIQEDKNKKIKIIENENEIKNTNLKIKKSNTNTVIKEETYYYR